MKLKVIEISYPTQDSVSLKIEKPVNFLYKAGQHASITFQIDNNNVTRTYSFSSTPDVDEYLSITIKSIKGGSVSNFLMTNKPEEVEVANVGGIFHQPKSLQRNLIMIAAGSGITPIYSMIRGILHSELKTNISLIYSNKTHDTIIFRDELFRLSSVYPERLRIYHVLTQQEEIHADFPVYYKGRLSKLVLKKTLKNIVGENIDHYDFYVCGPSGFMMLADDVLAFLNIDSNQIFKEVFFTPESPESFLTNLPSQEIIIESKDGEQLLEVKGQSILAAAMSRNIRLAYSCTQGQCGMCRAQLVTGEVKMRKNHVLTPDELNQGQILLCQAFPLSNDVTVRPLNHP